MTTIIITGRSGAEQCEMELNRTKALICEIYNKNKLYNRVDLNSFDVHFAERELLNYLRGRVAILRSALNEWLKEQRKYDIRIQMRQLEDELRELEMS